MLKIVRWIVVSCSVSVFAAWADAEELDTWWVKPSPSIQEISGGKLKVGDKITRENVELVKDQMPTIWYQQTLEGAVWEIVSTTPGKELVIPDLIRATKQNLGKAMQRPDGTVTMRDGSPWIGGFPFPENPETPLQVMGNRLFRNSPEKYAYNGKGYWINSDGKVYKNSVVSVMQQYATSRVCKEPKPALPGFEDQLLREVILLTDPYDVRGLSILSVIYVDQTKLPDAWGYIPVLRRVARFSSGQRYDSTDGSDIRAGDVDLFSDPLDTWEFKLIGRKFMFAGIAGGDQLPGGAPLFQKLDRGPELINGRYATNARVELRDTFILDARPKDPSHIYSRKRLYIDAATWWSTLGEFYDRQGELFITNDFRFEKGDDPEHAACGNYLKLVWISILNHQTRGGIWYIMARGPTHANYWIGPLPGAGTFTFGPRAFSVKDIISVAR